MLPIVHAVIQQQLENLRICLNLGLARKRQQIRLENDPFLLSRARFIELFRLTPELARELVELIRPHVPHCEMFRAIKVEAMLLCALGFYATGSYQRCVGEEYNFGMAQSTIHKYIHIVTNVLNDHLVPTKIIFPLTEQSRDNIKMEFSRKWGFPGIIGVVDGTHISILKPNVEEYNFINRKGFHSINAQIICDHNLKIINVFANYGGATHDSFIWRNSAVDQYLRTLAPNERCWLIGDSGYPLQQHLITPYRQPNNQMEIEFNRAHRRARNCVERCIGLLKIRFRCLLKERSARYNPAFVCKLIKVCAALHNICIDGNVPLLPYDMEIPVEDNLEQNGAEVVEDGRDIRDFIAYNYFG